MAYVSRIWLNPWRRQTRRFFRDPQALHAAVLAGLPAQPVDQRVLWRLDGGDARVIGDASREPARGVDGSPAHRIALYVVTRTSPSWEHLVEQAGWPSASGGEPQAAVRSYGPLLNRLHAGDRFAFRLAANPTRSVRAPSDDGAKRPRGKRVAHITARQQLEWLVAKAQRLGFEIPTPHGLDATPGGDIDVRIVSRQVRTFTKRRSGSHRVTVATVTFDGRLIVSDPELLRGALLDGIGPAKAYGCGLMTLAPVSS